MPHARCSVCCHPEFEAIDKALKAGTSVRETARRFSLSPAAVDRHRHHGEHEKTLVNIDQIARIDEEIKKLIRAQNRAKKKRDTAGALAIARELRNWFVLRTKAEVFASASKPESSAELSRAEAVTMAKSIIEAELASGSSEVAAWLHEVQERAQYTNKRELVPGEEIQSGE
jgi:hypothetical protein